MSRVQSPKKLAIFLCRYIDLFQGAPIAGYILSASGGQQKGIEAYHPAIFYAGSMALGATSLVGFVRLKTDRHLLKKL